MPGEILVFDAAGSNADGTSPGTPLNVGPGTTYGLRACAFPAPQQSVQYAGSTQSEGSLPATRKHENRSISLTIMCSTAAALQALQGKVGKIAREGGTLKWVLPNAETVIFDLHTADAFEPKIEMRHYVNAGGHCEAEITLVAQPYGRGTPTTLTGHTATDTKAPLVFTETGLKGDVPGLATLQVANATNSKIAAFWGLRSRYYNSAANAGLLIAAETGGTISFPPLISAPDPGAAGASGAGTDKVMRCTNLRSVDNFLMFVGTTSAAHLKHVGTYRLYARVQALSGNTGTVSLGLASGRVGGGKWVYTDTDVAIADDDGTPINGVWVIVDLGLISLRKPLGANDDTFLALIGKSTVDGSDDIDVDWFAFVPADEGSGAVKTVVAGSGFTGNPWLGSGDSLYITDTGVNLNRPSNGAWWAPLSYEGDYLTVPPARAEGRTAEFIVFLTGTPSTGHLTDTLVDAPNLDAITATLTYTPRYLSVPTP